MPVVECDACHCMRDQLCVMLPLVCRRIIYHGPVSDVQRHFEDVGFSLPPRMDLPSWLVEITTPAGDVRFPARLLRLVLVTQQLLHVPSVR
jgi:hypothetical protein